MERPTIKEIDSAAETYVSARDKRMAAGKKEFEAKKKLIDICWANKAALSKDSEGGYRYTYDDMVVEIKPGKDNVRVHPAEDEEEEAESTD